MATDRSLRNGMTVEAAPVAASLIQPPTMTIWSWVSATCAKGIMFSLGAFGVASPPMDRAIAADHRDCSWLEPKWLRTARYVTA
mmetsp:Transcript_15635/g.12526  ORF Transcript_15635/g.12526 Transcript_15635/m.12526 type:complete len:84 (-) Transcript_15635:13-264(-)